MPRNATGTYSLPVTAFVSASIMISGDMNTDLTDIATALTQSVATNGVSPVTGPIKLANGSLTAPSLAFHVDNGVGFYRVGANIMGIVVASATVGTINASATVQWNGDQLFTSVTVAGAISVDRISASLSITGGLILTNGLVVGLATAPVSDEIIVGDASNFFISGVSSEWSPETNNSFGFTPSTNTWYVQSSAGVGQNLTDTRARLGGALTSPEVTAPASAPANSVYLYTAADNQNSMLKYKDENGVETVMGQQGYWEIIATMTLSTSVAAAGFTLTKTYKRLVIAFTSVSPSTLVSNEMLQVGLSDNGGTSIKTVDGEILGKINGTDADSPVTAGTVLQDTFSIAGADLNGVVEISECEGTGLKNIYGMASSNTNVSSLIHSSRTASMGAVNYIQLALAGGNIDNGRFMLFGMVN